METNKTHQCPICESKTIDYDFTLNENTFFTCEDCGFIFLDPAKKLSTEKNNFFEDTTHKSDTIGYYLGLLAGYHGKSAGELLIIGPDCKSFSEAAAAKGFTPHCFPGLNDPTLAGKKGSYDLALLIDFIEYEKDPVGSLKNVHEMVKNDGSALVVTPSLFKWSKKHRKHRCKIFNTKTSSYFDSQTIQNALSKAYFNRIYVAPDYQHVPLRFIKKHPYLFNFTFGLGLLRFFSYPLPFLNGIKCKAASNNAAVLSKKAPAKEKPVLSIIMPVYNEVHTFPKLMELVTSKKLEGVDKEIVVVESNSNDGTREEALKFKDTPGIKVILEDKPRGKGHAVRNGIDNSTGDFYIIQDGDLEYDINDYDRLVEPLAKFRKAFILGSRHSKGFKMRDFKDQKFMSTFMNAGQIFFTWMVNLFAGSKLKDPFTMYKVIRKDCLYNIDFFSNGFDWDWEVVVKLVKKGFMPIELPVNYTSRSFSEGKKISLWRDPIICTVALLRIQFSKLFVKRFEKQYKKV